MPGTVEGHLALPQPDRLPVTHWMQGDVLSESLAQHTFAGIHRPVLTASARAWSAWAWVIRARGTGRRGSTGRQPLGSKAPLRCARSRFASGPPKSGAFTLSATSAPRLMNRRLFVGMTLLSLVLPGAAVAGEDPQGCGPQPVPAVMSTPSAPPVFLPSPMRCSPRKGMRALPAG